MPAYFLTTALLIVSLLTNVTVEAIKKILDSTTVNYSSNVLAAVSTVVISIALSAVFIIMNNIVFSLKIGVEISILIYLSFLASTVGYDKIIQMVNQIRSIKGD